MKKHADLLLRHADHLDEELELRRGLSIAIADGKIKKIAPLEELSEAYDFDRELEGKGLLYMPGLVDSHMHTGQQLLRGQVLDAMPMIWTRIMLPFESTLNPEKMRLSAELAALCMIHSGTTGFIDAGSYFMEEAAEVYLESGLRGALSYSTMDQKGLPDSISTDAKEAIRRAYNDTGRLIDPHTAVGYKVMRENKTEGIPCVLLSTASPYKFCKDVYEAIFDEKEKDSAGKDGFYYMEKLSEGTGTAAPESLRSLKSKPVIRKDLIDIEDMGGYILKKAHEDMIF